MKTFLKLAMGVAVAGSLMKLLSKQSSGKRRDAREPLPSAEGPIPSIPVETLNDSAGTPLSASHVLERRSAESS